MSDYHILDQRENHWSMRVIFHIPVSQTATNEANILYTDIVKATEDLNSLIPNFSSDFPTEYQDMQDGKVIERKKTILFSSNTLTPAQRKDEIINGNINWEGYNTFKTNLIDQLMIVWEWYGENGDVT